MGRGGPARRWTVTLAAVVLLVAAGCKKKTPPPPPVEQVPVQTVESELQITTVTPSSFEEGSPIEARVYGSAFADGAQVLVGSQEASSVTVIDPNTLAITVPALAVGSYDVVVRNPDGASATLRQGIQVRRRVEPQADCQLVKVYFGFDQAGLTPEARRLLDAKVSCYQQASHVRVAGHADERGTTDYNLALGQRRADAVKRYLSTMGVAGSKIKTVSYGEERPDVRGHDEAAWAKNRRAEIRVD